MGSVAFDYRLSNFQSVVSMYVHLSVDCKIKCMAFVYSVTLKLALCVLFLFDLSHMVVVASLSLLWFLALESTSFGICTMTSE